MAELLKFPEIEIKLITMTCVPQICRIQHTLQATAADRLCGAQVIEVSCPFWLYY